MEKLLLELKSLSGNSRITIFKDEYDDFELEDNEEDTNYFISAETSNPEELDAFSMTDLFETLETSFSGLMDMYPWYSLSMEYIDEACISYFKECMIAWLNTHQINAAAFLNQKPSYEHLLKCSIEYDISNDGTIANWRIA